MTFGKVQLGIYVEDRSSESSDPEKYKDCLDDVIQLGKFEGEQPYVPYFWEIYLDGNADRDDGKVLGFDVSKKDKAIFPELKRRRTVNLQQTDQGFVVEV